MERHLEIEWVKQQLPKRNKKSNKGSYGSLTVLAGSSRYRGAATLAVSGALHAGVGLVRLASTEAVCAAVAAQQPCCVFEPLEQDGKGGIQAKQLPLALRNRQSAILAGCGLGNTAETAELIETLLHTADCPLVLDADALNVIAGHLDTGSDWQTRERCLQALGAAKKPVILTPHIGEMARLSGLSADIVAQSQTGTALDFSQAHHCITVVKSNVTVIATPKGEVYINDRAGNPGMAKGGSGDVLAGIIAALLAQGIEAGTAAAAGVWLHATAGDKAAETGSLAGLSPAELPFALDQVWLSIDR